MQPPVTHAAHYGNTGQRKQKPAAYTTNICLHSWCCQHHLTITAITAVAAAAAAQHNHRIVAQPYPSKWKSIDCERDTRHRGRRWAPVEHLNAYVCMYLLYIPSWRYTYMSVCLQCESAQCAKDRDKSPPARKTTTTTTLALWVCVSSMCTHTHKHTSHTHGAN